VPDARTVALVALRLAVAVAAMAGVGAIAHLPLGEPPREAALRVALRTSLGQVEICHDRTAEELAALPAHMRQARTCEITTVDYRLRVTVDGRPLVDRAVVHHGVRRNRPLVVDELRRLAPGVHRVEVRFEPAASEIVGAGELPRAVYEGEVDFAAGRIRLLTLDPGAAAWSLAG
jgi:hypothetical protein